MTTARGIRNNNPGNIEAGAFTKRQQGYSGPEPEGRFATFASMGYGIAALIALLKVYRKQHKLTTVRGIINRWAPPVENQTSAYVTAVCDGWVTPDEELPDEPNTYLFLAQRIARHENGAAQAAKITAEDWNAGLSIAGLAAPIRDAAPPIYPPENKMPLPAIIAAIIPSLLSAAPELIKLMGDRSKESSEQYTKLATKAAEIAVKATDAINVQEAVEKLESDPEARTRYQMALKDEWFALSEAGGGGITGAREFAETMTSEGPQWRQIAFSAMLGLLAIGVVLGGGAVMAWLLTHGIEEAQAAQILDYFKAAGFIVLGYVFGSSAGSRRKDELVK